MKIYKCPGCGKVVLIKGKRCRCGMKIASRNLLIFGNPSDMKSMLEVLKVDTKMDIDLAGGMDEGLYTVGTYNISNRNINIIELDGRMPPEKDYPGHDIIKNFIRSSDAIWILTEYKNGNAYIKESSERINMILEYCKNIKKTNTCVICCFQSGSSEDIQSDMGCNECKSVYELHEVSRKAWNWFGEHYTNALKEEINCMFSDNFFCLGVKENPRNAGKNSIKWLRLIWGIDSESEGKICIGNGLPWIPGEKVKELYLRHNLTSKEEYIIL